jgi:hypothetical protein
MALFMIDEEVCETGPDASRSSKKSAPGKRAAGDDASLEKAGRNVLAQSLGNSPSPCNKIASIFFLENFHAK